MKRVYTNESLAEIGHLRNVLEQAGIACVIKNDQLSGGLGEIPFLECLPELWVVRDDQAERARGLLEELWSDAGTGEPWRCRRCGEQNERQFAACWRCGETDTE